MIHPDRLWLKSWEDLSGVVATWEDDDHNGQLHYKKIDHQKGGTIEKLRQDLTKLMSASGICGRKLPTAVEWPFHPHNSKI